MDDLQLSPFMKAANDHIINGKGDLASAVSAFGALEPEDQRLEFEKLCQRKLQVKDELIDLLFAIGAKLPRQRPVSFRYLEKSWLKRGKDPLLAGEMLTIICEQFAP